MLNNQRKLKLSSILFIFVLCHAIIIIKLYFIQIQHTDFFQDRAHQQYHVRITAAPERAWIYDRTGNQALALNKDSTSAFIVPNNLINAQTVKNFLKKYFPQAYERLLHHGRQPFMYVKRHLTEQEKAIINNAHLEDIRFLTEPSRFYPVESLGPIIGITDSDNQGIMGIELYCNKELAGTKSSYFLDKDARSGQFYFKKETTKEGAQGSPVYLTIDSTLQFLAYQELKKTMTEFESKQGAVIIMNPDNGDILAMVNYPDFDPNQTNTLDLEVTKNRIVTDSYELGSVMKIFFGLAGVAERIVTPDTIIDCENKTTARIDGMHVNTWKAHGLLTFSEVIELSNNIGTAKVALQLGTKLYDHYVKCGFSKKTGITFPGEQRGFITNPSTWSRQSLASLSYGYEIRATLLQLATAFCLIANSGYQVKPRLLLSESIEKSKEALYPPEVMEQIREILRRTITQGTAHKAHIKGYTVLGKTGSARLLVDGKYQPHKNIFTFAGIVEMGNYKRVIVTFIKETNRSDVYSSSVGAPLFEHIAEKMLIHERVII